MSNAVRQKRPADTSETIVVFVAPWFQWTERFMKHSNDSLGVSIHRYESDVTHFARARKDEEIYEAIDSRARILETRDDLSGRIKTAIREDIEGLETDPRTTPLIDLQFPDIENGKYIQIPRTSKIAQQLLRDTPAVKASDFLGAYLPFVTMDDATNHPDVQNHSGSSTRDKKAAIKPSGNIASANI